MGVRSFLPPAGVGGNKVGSVDQFGDACRPRGGVDWVGPEQISVGRRYVSVLLATVPAWLIR